MRVREVKVSTTRATQGTLMILEERKEAVPRRGGVRGLELAAGTPPTRALLHHHRNCLQPALQKDQRRIRVPDFQRQKLQGG